MSRELLVEMPGSNKSIPLLQALSDEMGGFFPYLFFLWAGLVPNNPETPSRTIQGTLNHGYLRHFHTILQSPPTEGKAEESNQILPQQKLMVTGGVSCFPLLFSPFMSPLSVWL